MPKNNSPLLTFISMASISKAQALALADNFLDDIGSSKDELRPRETFSELIVIAGDMVEDMQENLKGNVATGNLSESIEATEPEVVGKKLQVDIEMNFYGQFINKGVKGTRGGSSRAGYKFRNENPSKKHVDAIRKWIKDAGLKVSVSDVKKYGAYGKNEKKNVKVSELGAAYAVARAIKIHGIKPTGFVDKAVISTANKVAERLGTAFKVDIINSIK